MVLIVTNPIPRIKLTPFVKSMRFESAQLHEHTKRFLLLTDDQSTEDYYY